MWCVCLGGGGVSGCVRGLCVLRGDGVSSSVRPVDGTQQQEMEGTLHRGQWSSGAQERGGEQQAQACCCQDAWYEVAQASNPLAHLVDDSANVRILVQQYLTNDIAMRQLLLAQIEVGDVAHGFKR